MSYFDDNDLSANDAERLRYFYEEFSSDIRRRLLSKNLLSPQNVYDVLYHRTRESLLAKNIPKITDLEESSKSIRDALIAKLVSENIDLEKISEDTRKSLLARNKLIQDSDNLLGDSYVARQNALTKNKPSEGDLLKDSNSFRENNIAKNDINNSSVVDYDSKNEEFRLKNIAKNVPSTGDLLTDSVDYRKNNVIKNDGTTDDLEKTSADIRNANLSKNAPSNITLDAVADAQRIASLSKNSSVIPADNSDEYRAQALSKNVSSEADLLSGSDDYRKNNTSLNVKSEGDLLKDSDSYRANNISSNTSKTTDLESLSEEYRISNTSSNVPTGGDLLSDSEQFLQNNIASNKPVGGDLLSDSEQFLANNISSNKPTGGDLLDDSAEYLQKNIAGNKPTGGDLLADSASYLQSNVTSNKPVAGDLLSDSKQFLTNNISVNKPIGGDLLSDSKPYLQGNVSANKPAGGDLLADSAEYLQGNVSANKPTGGDLLTDSESFFANNTSVNVPSTGDLLTDSAQFLDNNTSANVPDSGDLLTDSEQFLANNVAANVPDNGDLLTDSSAYLNNNLAPNVPDNGDLLTDSNGYLNANLASNVPTGGDLLTDSNAYLNANLAPNVPSTGDLLSDSHGFLNSNLASNVPSGGDLLSDSSSVRNDLLSSNVSSGTDLEAMSKVFRNNLLAANPNNSLGVMIEGMGTATFLGVSKVMTQGILLRQVLLSKNRPSKYSIDTTADQAKNELFAKNDFQLNSNEYGTASANLASGNFNSYYGKIAKEEVQIQINRNLNYTSSTAKALQNKYGTNSKDVTLPASIGGGFFSVDTVSPKGGYFEQQGALTRVPIDVSIHKGTITDAIRNYNLSRNLYNLYKLTPGDLASLTVLQANNDEGFQDLLASTIGHLKGNDSIGSQLQGNLVPRGILVANEGAYLKGGSPETMYRPQQGQGMQVGTAESMMAKTVLGNPLMDEEFKSGAKGVVHIIRTIRNSNASDFTGNYDSQNSKKYVIGLTKDNAPKVARQRFTIANPYKPGIAKSLHLSLKNYSSGEEFYFPPYVQDFSDSYGANWNSVNFLGRPEPVFTYNNSSREGSITFVILTDYTQNLVIGHNFGDESISEVKVNPKTHFTDRDTAANLNRDMALQQSEANQQDVNKKIKEMSQKQDETAAAGAATKLTGYKEASSTYAGIVSDLKKEANSIQTNQENLLVKGNSPTTYSESNNIIGNVNDFLITKVERDAGDIDTKAEDTKKRVDEMIKNLAFQPSFFSGDKIDFVTKMEFLAKMTRPAKADEGSGFSFTRPPVCHIHLGDWWNNDIVVDNVAFSYADAPWTLDEGRVQPMWATVTLSFKFIGAYRAQPGGPVLSDDKGGFYQPRK